MNAEIIAVGTELLMGELVDSNSTYIASELPTIGVDLQLVAKVGDNIQTLTTAIANALDRSDLLITTGGLGPTSDDLTRESIANFFEEEMFVDSRLLADLKEEFKKRGTDMPQSNIKQASIIPSGSSIPNPHGTAPGWFVNKNGKTIVALPGPPLELIPMWINYVKPKIKALKPGIFIKTQTVKSFGISEGSLDETFSHLFDKPNPILGIYSKQDGIHLRAIATASTEKDCIEILKPVIEEIKDVLGNSIWGFDDDNLADVLGNKLIALDRNICVIELFTGGQLCSLLNESTYASKRLTSGFVHSRASEDAKESIQGKMKDIISESGTDLGLYISDIQMDQNNLRGSGKVFFEIFDGDEIHRVHGKFRSDSLRMKQRAANQALLSLLSHLKAS